MHPAAKHSWRSPFIAAAVKAMMGIGLAFCKASKLRISRVAARPSNTGISVMLYRVDGHGENPMYKSNRAPHKLMVSKLTLVHQYKANGGITPKNVHCISAVTSFYGVTAHSENHSLRQFQIHLVVVHQQNLSRQRTHMD